MNEIQRLPLLFLLLVALTGCVQTRPLMSHSHIGHALTTWHDTPGQQGLYTVAAKELDVAIEAVGKALSSPGDPRRAAKHVDNALHALNPDLQRFGVGLDYGAIRAMQGAIDHLEYAAASDDASGNFISSVVSLVDQGDLVVARMVKAQEAIVAFDRSGTVNDPNLSTAHRFLMAAKYGDPNGVPDSNSMARAEHGLVHMSAQLNDMLKREVDPRYEPVPRRYVLGLVKLPNGHWGYRLSKPAYSGGGYRY